MGFIVTIVVNGITSTTPFKTPYKNHAAYYIFKEAIDAGIAPTALAHPNFFGTAALIDQSTYSSKTLEQKNIFFSEPIEISKVNHYFSNQHGDREDLDFINQMRKIFNNFPQLKGSTIV